MCFSQFCRSSVSTSALMEQTEKHIRAPYIINLYKLPSQKQQFSTFFCFWCKDMLVYETVFCCHYHLWHEGYPEYSFAIMTNMHHHWLNQNLHTAMITWMNIYVLQHTLCSWILFKSDCHLFALARHLFTMPWQGKCILEVG